ncbi:hypothetical protein MLD38_036128 [Melastoma candidum]|uniref:Uncharacterized protein n=1 Tax=Melastoma candidum TaxID=119954 RepID=A0ACB9LJ04_9MYRT|nr:hypothetical protein MLD38_036128 [Melastoma candidum]
MAMEVLRPRDCYRTDHHLPRSGRGSCRNSFSAPRPATRRHPRDREATASARPEARQRGRFVRARSEPAIPTQEEAGQQPGASGRGAGVLVMEKVTILRRGESLDSATMKATMTGGGGGATFGDLYAGMAFAVSPEPSSLPVPSFGRARKDRVSGGGAPVDDSATRDLRRLLRLD